MSWPRRFFHLTPVLVVCATAAGAQTEHPRLPAAAAANCALCHDDILEAATSLHEVAEDCSMCHEVSSGDEGSFVALVEREPALCVMCHDDLESAVEMELETPHYPVEDSCLNCHVPHSSSQPKLLQATTVELCSGCHDVEDLQSLHGGQLTTSTQCGACHQPHGSDNPSMLGFTHMHGAFESGSCDACHREPFSSRVRLRVRGERLCEACHGDITEGLTGSVHAALTGDRARAGCLNCHDPHMANNKKLLENTGPSLCASCHAKTVSSARAKTGHEAASDDCGNCHQPHASEHPKLLGEAEDEICGMCHDLTDTDLQTTHMGAPLDELTCTSCHTPHGSGHESLLARTLHPALEEGCELCHDGSFDQFVDAEVEVCAMCHDDVISAASEATVSHDAMEMESCVLCHNPHASPQEKLVKLPGAGPCVECHDDKGASADEVEHGIIGTLGCRACHEPHGGEKEKLLRETGPALCLECHSTETLPRVSNEETIEILGGLEVETNLVRSFPRISLSSDGQRDHPVTNHRVLGTPSPEDMEASRIESTFIGEFTCLTCHNPHKGSSAHLFRSGISAPQQLCRECHEK